MSFHEYSLLKFLGSFVPSFVLSFARSFLRSSVPPFLRSFVPSFLRSFVPSFLRSFVPSFLRSFVPSFVCSFVPSCLRSFINLLYRLGIECKDPGEISSGNRRVEGVQAGKYIQYWCFESYDLIGSARIKCLETGEWSAPKPKCERT